MKGIILVNEGLESFAEKEIFSVLNSTCEIHEGFLEFEISSYKDLCKLCYLSKLSNKVLLKIASGKIDSSLESLNKIDLLKISEWVTPDVTFSVTCTREGTHDFNSHQAAITLGGNIKDITKSTVSLKNPEVPVLAYINDSELVLGVDFSGVDLGIHPYRVFSYGENIKGPVIHSINMFAEVSKTDTILDPFCLAGSLSVDQALDFSGKSIFFYNKDDFAFTNFSKLDFDVEDYLETFDETISKDKLNIVCSGHLQKNVRNAEKNAKIAGINKSINFTRNDIDWLDTKFEEKEIDKIVTIPPQFSKRKDDAFISSILDKFFYAAEYILKDDGSITMLFNRLDLLEELAAKYSFEIVDSFDVMQGSEFLEIFKLKKCKK